MAWNSGTLNTCRSPLVQTWAMPRPAMNRISVAMMGWMRKFDTSQPLNSPKQPATATGITMLSAICT